VAQKNYWESSLVVPQRLINIDPLPCGLTVNCSWYRRNFRKTGNSILANPNFADAENGDFSLKPGPALEHKQGLTNAAIFKTLWKRWQNREDKNEPFATGLVPKKGKGLSKP